MDEIVRVLFNTDHEAPSLTVVVVMIAIAIILPAITNYLGRRRQNGQGGQNSAPRKKGKKK